MIGYLNLVGGVSGDMLLGALIDAGVPIDVLKSEFKCLDVTGWDITSKTVRRGAINAVAIDVLLEDSAPTGLQWNTFRTYVDGSTLPPEDKAKAIRVFDTLERAENTAHGRGRGHAPSPLHELGTIDSLIDVVGVIVGLRALGIKALYSSPLPLAHGSVTNAHGTMPATALATQAIILEQQLPMSLSATNPSGESVTPTGAAILATLAQFTPATMVPIRVGHGAGKRDNATAPPNILSLWLGAEIKYSAQPSSNSGLVLLETNIDDMTGEALAYVAETLLKSKVRDVWFTPIYMKKGRPATILSVIAEAANEAQVTETIMRETTTLGIRRRYVQRHEAERRTAIAHTAFGDVKIKIKTFNSEGKVTQVASPEYEDCKRIAESTGTPLMEVMHHVSEIARALDQDL